MIQKKVCMVGVFATGKTSLVHRFVHSLFSAKYHSTVGVKIDRKQVQVGTERQVLYKCVSVSGVYRSHEPLLPSAVHAPS